MRNHNLNDIYSFEKKAHGPHNSLARQFPIVNLIGENFYFDSFLVFKNNIYYF